MKVYLGRQPILDRGRNVVGYELLFRSSEANFCDMSDDVVATSQVIVNAVLGVGLDRLLGGKPAFINFDRTLLLGDWSTLLPPKSASSRSSKPSRPDHEVLAACHKLRQQGYALALDDCLDDERTAAFAPFVDILKVDFLQTSAGRTGDACAPLPETEDPDGCREGRDRARVSQSAPVGLRLLSGILFRPAHGPPGRARSRHPR